MDIQSCSACNKMFEMEDLQRINGKLFCYNCCYHCSVCHKFFDVKEEEKTCQKCGDEE